MKIRAICKRCHRIRVIKEAGYCEACLVVLRAAERPKQRLSEIKLSPQEILGDPVPPNMEMREATLRDLELDRQPITDIGSKCLHCAGNGLQATLERVVTARGDVERCWQCGGEYRDGGRVWPLGA